MNLGDRRQLASYVGYVGIVAGALALVLLGLRAKADTAVLVAAVVAGAALVAWVVLDWERVRQALVGRQVKYGSSSALLTVSFIGILVVGNIASNRYYHRFDTTASRRYSLSAQTLQVLARVSDPIQIYSFLSEDDSRRDDFENLLEEYRHRQPLLQYTSVDIDAQPALARQFDVSYSGVVVFVRGERQQKIYALGESDLTGAILRVLRDTEPKVYWVTGHRERDFESYQEDGYSAIGEALVDEGYTVESLNLAAGEGLPTDAAVIVVASPRDEFTPEESARLTAYVEGGGRLLLLNDPGLPPVGADALALFGLQWDNDLIIDLEQSLMGTVGAPLVTSYPNFEITNQMQGLTTFYPYASSISTVGDGAPEGVTVTPFVQSSAGAWGETDLESSQPVYDAAADLAGPLDICVAAENSATSARIAACGDSDFATNQVFQYYSGTGNGDLIMNAINWLAEEEDLISIRTQDTSTRSVVMTPQQGRAVQLVTIIIMPLAVAAVGASVWWRRRS